MLFWWAVETIYRTYTVRIFTRFGFCGLQEVRNMHNEQLMGIRGEEEMEMSDDDMDDSSATNSKDSEDLGKQLWTDTKARKGAKWCRLLSPHTLPAGTVVIS